MKVDLSVVFYETLPHSAIGQAMPCYVFMSIPIALALALIQSPSCYQDEHMCYHPTLCLIADARHYYLLIINALQAIRVQTSLGMLRQ